MRAESLQQNDDDKGINTAMQQASNNKTTQPGDIPELLTTLRDMTASEIGKVALTDTEREVLAERGYPQQVITAFAIRAAIIEAHQTPEDLRTPAQRKLLAQATRAHNARIHRRRSSQMVHMRQFF